MYHFILIACGIYYVLSKYTRPQTQTRIDYLKNGLLSYALFRTRQHDIERLNTDYEHYDGTKLPMSSGSSLSNACLSYMIPKEEFKKDPWYTKQMENKIDAINKYIDHNFDTNDKVIEFFDSMLENDKKIANTLLEYLIEQASDSDFDNAMDGKTGFALSCYQHVKDYLGVDDILRYIAIDSRGQDRVKKLVQMQETVSCFK